MRNARVATLKCPLRNHDYEKHAFQCSRRGRGAGDSAAAEERRMCYGVGARRGCGDESSVHDCAGRQAGECWSGDASVPVPLHGATAESSRPTACAHCNCSSGGAGCFESSSGLAAIRWREVTGRADDFARGGGRALGWRSRPGVFWISTSSAKSAWNETRGAFARGQIADAFPAGNARRFG